MRRPRPAPVNPITHQPELIVERLGPSIKYVITFLTYLEQYSDGVYDPEWTRWYQRIHAALIELKELE